AHEPPIGTIEDIGPINAADAGRRRVGELLLPHSRGQVESEQGKALRRAVVPAPVNPLAGAGVVSAASLPAEAGRGRTVARTLLDPLVFRVRRPVRLGRRPNYWRRQKEPQNNDRDAHGKPRRKGVRTDPHGTTKTAGPGPFH